MEYKEFYVEGLFGLYNHSINFSLVKSSEKRASIIMLYGKNGIGKTTVLRMIEGLMQLDFTVFRQLNFRRAYLKFSNNETISVTANYDISNVLEYLEVEYRNTKVKLNPNEVGTLNPSEEQNQVKVRELYKKDLESFSFEFIDTERLMKKNIKDWKKKKFLNIF